MSRLIDADALEQYLSQCVFDEDTTFASWAIRHAPTVSAVPVVRCEQCKYAMPLVYGETEHIVSPNGEVMCGKSGAIGRFAHDWHKSDWFCADGERRGNDATD